jgi:hypothetical protein
MTFEEQFHAAGVMLLPYVSSEAKDWFIFSFLFTYLNIVCGYSLQSLRSFTAYDFINLTERGYDNWIVDDFVARLMKIYFCYIRVNWVKEENEFVASPCGKYRYLSGYFFVNMLGLPNPNIDEDLACDLGNNNAIQQLANLPETSDKKRRRRARIVSARNLRSDQTTKEFIFEKCMLQQWFGIDVMEKCPGGRGRGLIAAKGFQKHEVLLDYHGKKISRAEANEIDEDIDDHRSSYLFCGPDGLFWDGSAEFCECHPQSRLLGRLANFAAKYTYECNAMPQLFACATYNSKPFHAIVLVATREIEPLEEIRFDYGDRRCLKLFK